MINIEVCHNIDRVNPSFYLKFNVAPSASVPININITVKQTIIALHLNRSYNCQRSPYNSRYDTLPVISFTSQTVGT